MDPDLFLDDIERKPQVLRTLADLIDGGALQWPIFRPPSRVVLIGIGSSFYAATAAAQRLRVAGVDAVAESSAAESIGPIGPGELVIGISAGGESIETNRLFAAAGGGRRIAVTNSPGSGISRIAAATGTPASVSTIDIHADDERGGVACRTYVHTVVALLALERQLVAAPTGGHGVVEGQSMSDQHPDSDLARIVRRAADATESLLERRDRWLDSAVELLAGPNGTWLLAPLERVSSALQGALMMREGPRRAAVGCETGDWSHVHVYLTSTLDYRALIVAGSRWDRQAAEWLSKRRSTVVSIGGDFPGSLLTIDYPGSDDPLVALLTETIVAELIAASLWRQR